MSNLTEEELAAVVKKIAELDAKRTQGEWDVEGGGQIADTGDYSEQFVVAPDKGEWGEIIFRNGLEEDNLFAASAPLMAQVTRQLWAEREQQRAAMVQAREALGKISCERAPTCNAPSAAARIALTALAQLDAILEN